MGNRIYVGNLPQTITSEQLSQVFAPFGEVMGTTLIMDRETGRAKGFGFVEMADETSAHVAIASLNGTDMDGRALRVSEAQPRPERLAGSRDQRPQ